MWLVHVDSADITSYFWLILFLKLCKLPPLVIELTLEDCNWKHWTKEQKLLKNADGRNVRDFWKRPMHVSGSLGRTRRSFLAWPTLKRRQRRMIIRRRPTIIGTTYNVAANAELPISPGRSALASAIWVKSSWADIVLAVGVLVVTNNGNELYITIKKIFWQD